MKSTIRPCASVMSFESYLENLSVDVYAPAPDAGDDDPDGTRPTTPYMRATLPAPLACEVAA